MRVLLVVCHPVQGSFTYAAAEHSRTALHAAHHDVDMIDLYADGFDPVTPGDHGYGARLRAAKWLVLVYPTWWSSFPAALTGWINDVWTPDATRSLTRVIAVTSHGSSRWVNAVEGSVGRRYLRRVLPLPRGCRREWLAMYQMDASTPEQRRRHLDRISHTLGR